MVSNAEIVDGKMTPEDGPTTTAAATAPLNIQCDIIGADEGRVELVSRRRRWRGRGSRVRRLGAIREDDVVRGRLRGTLPQQNRSSSGSSSGGGGIGACGQAPCSYVMGTSDEDDVREEVSMLLKLLLLRGLMLG